jgi:hypothetical protein
MRLAHLSIAGLLGVVGFCAVGFGSLLYASTPWAGMTFSVMLGCLTIGLIALICCRSERRAFWIGFSISGWIYVILVHGPWFAVEIGPRLATTKILRWAYPFLIPDGRQSANPLNATQAITVLITEVDAGIDLRMTGKALVDVLANEGDDKPPSTLVQGVEYRGISTRDGKFLLVELHLNPMQTTKLRQAQANGVKTVLIRHQPSPSAVAWSNPPVQINDFQSVGHDFYAILFALAGGVVGRYFYSTRELPSIIATSRVSTR